MKHRFFYGIQPSIKQFRPEEFSRGAYECTQLFQSKNGTPVMLSHNTTMDIWKVECGFSTVFFGTKAEALAYCKGRFFDADGQVV